MAQHGSARLERARKRAQSSAALARELNVSTSTVRRWARDGVSRDGLRKLAALETSQRDARAQAKNDKRTFLELMKISGEDQVLPDIRSSAGVRAGPKTSGYQWTERIGLLKSAAAIAAITSFASSIQSRGFDQWQAVLTVSIYSKSPHLGYKTVYKQFPEEPEASGDFAIKSELASPRARALGIAIGAVLEMLDRQDGLVYVHAVTIYNYRFRTDDERRAYQTLQRRKKKQWQKKTSTKTPSSRSSRSRSATKKTRPGRSRPKTSGSRSKLRDFPGSTKKSRKSTKRSKPATKRTRK